MANREASASGIWRHHAENFYSRDDLMEARKCLKAAVPVELQIAKMRGGRNTKDNAMDDIVDTITELTEKTKMPLVLAIWIQIKDSPKSIGSAKPEPGVPELQTMIQLLESSMADFMKKNKEQMETMMEEIKKKVPEIHIDGPSKRRKVSERYDGEIGTSFRGMETQFNSSQRMEGQSPSFLQVAQAGLHPNKTHRFQPVLASQLTEALQNIEKTKEKPKGKNAFHCSASAETSSLLADIYLFCLRSGH